MKQGSVIVDVAVDQGGCIETTKPTTHDQPTYVVDGIIHYAVCQHAGRRARTSTLALTDATFPYREAARLGWREACKIGSSCCWASTWVEGKVVYLGFAEAFNLQSWTRTPCCNPDSENP